MTKIILITVAIVVLMAGASGALLINEAMKCFDDIFGN